MKRQIYAAYDDEGIFVYQAFSPQTVQAALAKGTFSTGFSLDRMTWIKPSFGWMLYRSGYAAKTRQQGILKIKLKHEGFLAILRQSVETNHDTQVFPTIDDWKRALRKSDVRHQWDPDRNLRLGKLNRRAIQIGIQGATVRHYVNDWIIGLEEVTELAHQIQAVAKMKQPFPSVPLERVYPVEPDLVHSPGISTIEAET
jgi:hypothetical protein